MAGKTRKTQILLAASFVVLMLTTACMTEAPEIEMEGDTDGASDVDLDNDASCYYQDKSSNQDGVVQWCNGEYDVRINFDFNSIVGGNQAFSYGISDVQLVNDSTYDKPLVAACCTDVRDVPGWSPGR